MVHVWRVADWEVSLSAVVSGETCVDKGSLGLLWVPDLAQCTYKNMAQSCPRSCAWRHPRMLAHIIQRNMIFLAHTPPDCAIWKSGLRKHIFVHVRVTFRQLGMRPVADRSSGV